MLVIFFLVFAVLIRNGDSDCMSTYQKQLPACQEIMSKAGDEASRMSADARDKKLCCAFNSFTTCVKDAGKGCGAMVESAMEQTLDMVKSTLGNKCGSYVCDGGNTLDPKNAVILYLLMFLGYFLYAN